VRSKAIFPGKNSQTCRTSNFQTVRGPSSACQPQEALVFLTVFKRTLLLLTISIPIFGLPACKASSGHPEEMLLAALLLPGAWEKVNPGPGSVSLALQSASGTFSRSFTPTCSGRPGTDPTYTFLVKRGTTNNLLINFMGGGACWSDTNCLGP